MANIRILVSGCDEEGVTDVTHLPGEAMLDHATACGLTSEMAYVWEDKKGAVTCPGCLNAARNILKNLTDAEIKQLRKKKA